MLLAMAAWGCLLFPRLAVSQDSPEVHIVPRVSLPPHGPRLAGNLSRTETLKSSVDLVLVPVTVTDDMGRIVTGLAKSNFVVYQDKRREQIRSLSRDDAPISVGIIWDTSGSMADKMANAREGIKTFLETANPKDEFFLITFSDQLELVSDFTANIDDIESKLVFPQAHGETALLDAVYLGISEMRHAHYARKALLIISDGGDNHSRYTEGEVKDVVEEADVQIFAIGLFDEFPRTQEEEEGPSLLTEVAEATGGRMFSIDNPNELSHVATKIGIALRDEYVLAYQPPTKPHDGKWHKIRVKLHLPKGLPFLHASFKQGYYAPVE